MGEGFRGAVRDASAYVGNDGANEDGRCVLLFYVNASVTRGHKLAHANLSYRGSELTNVLSGVRNVLGLFVIDVCYYYARSGSLQDISGPLQFRLRLRGRLCGLPSTLRRL